MWSEGSLEVVRAGQKVRYYDEDTVGISVYG